jgi:hypothetical protein
VSLAWQEYQLSSSPSSLYGSNIYQKNFSFYKKYSIQIEYNIIGEECQLLYLVNLLLCWTLYFHSSLAILALTHVVHLFHNFNQFFHINYILLDFPKLSYKIDSFEPMYTIFIMVKFGPIIYTTIFTFEH